MNVKVKDIKVVVFDLDDTLIRGDVADQVCKDTNEVIQLLQMAGYRLGIASHNDHADWYLKKNKLDAHFECVQAFHTKQLSKVKHMTNLMQIMQIQKHECILFDDHLEIVADIIGHGIRGVLVDENHGVTLKNVNFLCNRKRARLNDNKNDDKMKNNVVNQ